MPFLFASTNFPWGAVWTVETFLAGFVVEAIWAKPVAEKNVTRTMVMNMLIAVFIIV
jgi:uncharacterized PurR-regulated membrane protein YhhQ (DUF165 family)